MKKIMIMVFLLAAWTYPEAQQVDVKHIDSIANSFRIRKQILVLFEKLDTTDPSGRKFMTSRYYYFDEKQRKISSVREFENASSPRKGTQVIYTFEENGLVKVMVIPPAAECTGCASSYYYSGDSLLTKNEVVYKNANPEVFIKHSQNFKSKLPGYLPWGHFQNEVLLNGRMKKIRDEY